jgi:hypothetical protein
MMVNWLYVAGPNISLLQAITKKQFYTSRDKYR